VAELPKCFYTAEKDRERSNFIANIIAHADAVKMRGAAQYFSAKLSCVLVTK